MGAMRERDNFLSYDNFVRNLVGLLNLFPFFFIVTVFFRTDEAM